MEELEYFMKKECFNHVSITSSFEKRWMRLIPLVFITYSLAYLDQSQLWVWRSGRNGEDLNITAGVSSFLAALFFLGYFFFQIPGAHYAEKKSAKILIFGA
ncbi:hypothetical protein KEH51_08645 [[Brevibacterium] frigoritolerans]|uniref:Uncharacterized protein n=1 Tax=Peribacillus frigoritolerans TaxID=450367 RepID=A0A941FQ15_9BACI|nr:hypothetical protein [Peribacillus frigoritolerans]